MCAATVNYTHVQFTLYEERYIAPSFHLDSTFCYIKHETLSLTTGYYFHIFPNYHVISDVSRNCRRDESRGLETTDFFPSIMNLLQNIHLFLMVLHSTQYETRCIDVIQTDNKEISLIVLKYRPSRLLRWIQNCTKCKCVKLVQNYSFIIAMYTFHCKVYYVNTKIEIYFWWTLIITVLFSRNIDYQLQTITMLISQNHAYKPKCRSTTCLNFGLLAWFSHSSKEHLVYGTLKLGHPNSYMQTVVLLRELSSMTFYVCKMG